MRLGLTIDSEHSQDLDDAVWATQTASKILVSVHITDIESLITPELEEKASKQITTIYHPYSTIPLFNPEVEQQASLLPGKRRPVITVNALFNPDLPNPLESSWIEKNEIESQAKLSYLFVDGVLGGARHSRFSSVLLLLDKAARLSAFWRKTHGGIYAQRFGQSWIDAEGRLIKRFLRSQEIVAEFMILANYLVAKQASALNALFLYRNHQPRVSKDDQLLIDMLFEFGNQDEILSRLGSSLGSAAYQASSRGHFGLGLPHYCHFTSPIRRYADLVNQRIFKALMKGRKPQYSVDELNSIADSINIATLAKKEKYKRLTKREQQKALSNLNRLPELNAQAFSSVISAAVKSNRLEGVLQEALNRSNLTQLDYYRLLVAASGHTEERLELLKRLENRPDLIAIANIMAQKADWCSGYRIESQVIEVLPGGGRFVAALVAVINGQDLTGRLGEGVTKNATRLKAAYCFFEDFIQGNLVPFQGFVIKKTVTQSEVDPESGVIAISLINEWAQNRKIALPEYQFRRVDDTFTCTCNFADQSTTGEGRSKKEAKRKAAVAMWDLLQSRS